MVSRYELTGTAGSLRARRGAARRSAPGRALRARARPRLLQFGTVAMRSLKLVHRAVCVVHVWYYITYMCAYTTSILLL